jgi:hypothetical protein
MEGEVKVVPSQTTVLWDSKFVIVVFERWGYCVKNMED